LKIVVDAQGNVSEVKVTKSLEKGLDESAVNTVKTWKFKPATKNGKPVSCRPWVEVSFKLY
jgi:protein TonB